jgi:hypothetical protein
MIKNIMKSQISIIIYMICINYSNNNLYTINITDLKTNITAGKKQTGQGFKKILSFIPSNKLTRWKYYIGVGLGHTNSSTPPNKSIFTRTHTVLLKQTFFKKIQKFSYTTPAIGQATTPKKQQITPEQTVILWDYFTHIFERVSIKEGQIKFIVKNLLLDQISIKDNINPLAIESFVYLKKYFNLINNTNYQDITLLFHFINWINYNDLCKGIQNISHDNIIELFTSYMYINGEKCIKKEKKDMEILQQFYNQINKKQENKFFLQSLIPIEKKNHQLAFITIDKKGNFFSWKNQEYLNDQDLEKTHFVPITDFDKFLNKETKVLGENVSSANPLSKTKKKKINYQDFSKEILIFRGNHISSKYLTYINMLLHQDNDFDINIITFKDWQQKLITFKDQENELQATALSKSLFFLFGFQGQNTKTGSLPDTYVKDLTDYDNQMTHYDFPNYIIEENDNILKQALHALPKTEDIEINQTIGGLCVGIFNEYFCCMSFFNYVFYNEKESFERNFYLDIFAGMRIMENFYLCGVLNITNARYFFHTFCDPLIGIGFLINLPPVLLRIWISFDIYNNLFYIGAQLYLTKCVYGEIYKFSENEIIEAAIEYI